MRTRKTWERMAVLHLEGTKTIRRFFLLQSIRQRRDKEQMANVSLEDKGLGFVLSRCGKIHSRKGSTCFPRHEAATLT